MSAAAVVVAAGRGERLGGAVPKALVEVAGRPLVAHAVAACVAAGLAPVVVVHPPEARAATAAAVAGFDVVLVPGGATRADSVRAGLEVVGDAPLVAVHDAARGLQPAAVIAATVAAVSGDVVAAAPGLPVTDTVKRTVDGVVTGTVDRADLVAIQTPQVAVTAVLRDAHAAGAAATDDLAVLEAHLGADGVGRIVHVAGSALGRKVTYPEDVVTLEALLAAADRAAAP